MILKAVLIIGILVIWICLGFRVSDFGFLIFWFVSDFEFQLFAQGHVSILETTGDNLEHQEAI